MLLSTLLSECHFGTFTFNTSMNNVLLSYRMAAVSRKLIIESLRSCRDYNF